MSQFRITATAPTTYQVASLRLFGMPVSSHMGGSHSAEEYFDTEEEAKAYLTKRAEMYFEVEADLIEAIEDINKYSSLSLDAVTAHIIEVEEADAE